MAFVSWLQTLHDEGEAMNRREVRRYANQNGLRGMQARVALCARPVAVVQATLVAPQIIQPSGSIRIEEWSVYVVDGGPFMAPELHRIGIQGLVANHPRYYRSGRVQTSAIVTVSGRTVQTASGSIYFLGKPSADYVRWLREQGKSLDEAQPIKFL